MKPIFKCGGKYVDDPALCSDPVLLLDGARRVRLSRLLSGLLRHYPHLAGLRVDREGWVSIDDLVEGIRLKWWNNKDYQWVTREHIIAVASLDPKGRFEIRDGRIRARYGHSIDVEIDYPVYMGDDVLFHGTSVERLSRIMREGLLPMHRKYVHLTSDPRIAYDTGRRHGPPVVLRVNVECLRKNGIRVYRASKKIFLAKRVPPACISV